MDECKPLLIGKFGPKYKENQIFANNTFTSLVRRCKLTPDCLRLATLGSRA